MKRIQLYVLLVIMCIAGNLQGQQLWFFGVQDSLGVPTIEIGDTALKTLRIRNIDSTALDLTLSIGGIDTSEFVIKEGGGAIHLPRTVSHLLTIEFRPRQPGKKDLFFQIESADSSHSTIFLPVSARAIDIKQPLLHVAADSLFFGVVKTGDTSGTSIRISNFGNTNLDISNFAIAGRDSSEFEITRGGDPILMVPGRHISVYVDFVPNLISIKDAALRITSNDTARPVLNLPLIAEGIFAGEPEIRIEADSLIFPETAIGDTALMRLRVYNDGTANLSVPNLLIAGGAAGDFEVTTNDSGFFVVPGLDYLIQVAFMPTELDIRSANLIIASNDADEDSLVVTLIGRGLPPLSDVPDDDPPLPLIFELRQNYPNPFNPITTIEFALAEESGITLRVYDLLGREVITLAVGEYVAGLHQLQWEADGFAAGAYFYRLTGVTTSGMPFEATRRMVLLK